MQEYKPISCEYYDYIEHYAVKGEIITIEFMDDYSFISTIQDVILDTHIKDKEEFIILKSGKRIRMDHVIRLNDYILSDYPSC